MPKRKCVVKFVDSFGIEHAAKVEAESLFEAAIRGLQRLDSSFWTEEDVFDRMCITVEVHEEPTIHTVMIEKLKRWIKSHGRHPREEAKKEEWRRLLFGTKHRARLRQHRHFQFVGFVAVRVFGGGWSPASSARSASPHCRHFGSCFHSTTA